MAVLLSRFMILGKAFLSLAKLHAYKNASRVVMVIQQDNAKEAHLLIAHTEQKISKYETVSQLSQLPVPGMLHRQAQGVHVVHSG